MKTLKDLTQQARDLLDAIAFDAANGAITPDAFNAHLSSYDHLYADGRFAILHSTVASVEESDDKLIAAHQLNGAINAVLLALSTLKPIVEKHGRAFPPPPGVEDTTPAIRQRGPNGSTLHVSISGGPFIGKFHLVALLERVLNEVAIAGTKHPQSRERLAVEVVKPVDATATYDVVAKAMFAGPFRELFEEGCARTFFPGLDRVVITTLEHSPSWLHHPKLMSSDDFLQREVEHNQPALGTVALAGWLPTQWNESVATEDTQPEGTS